MGLRVGCGRDGLIIACLPWLVQVRQLRPVARDDRPGTEHMPHRVYLLLDIPIRWISLVVRRW
jgi:hypothetical protein